LISVNESLYYGVSREMFPIDDMQFFFILFFSREDFYCKISMYSLVRIRISGIIIQEQKRRVFL